MSNNSSWQNHLNNINQIYGNSANAATAGSHTHGLSVNHSNCAVNCGGPGCGGSLLKQQSLQTLSGVLAGSIYTSPTFTIPDPLTPEETKELQQLEEMRKIETKALKLKEFKKLPSQLRQHVVDQIMWVRTIGAMNSIEASQSDREKELQTRKGWNTLSGLSSYISSFHHQHQAYPGMWGGSTDTSQYISGIRLPAGITEDDIIDAHNEATLEEQLLGSNDETPVQADKA